jgi:DNA processing protein
VGTRRCSEYGVEATKQITKELAQAGVTIVSGLARGIDTWAHKTALEYNAPTIAVLGSGVEDTSIYPVTNKKLARDIIEAGGLVVSEYTAADTNWKSNFPTRNRIVAALANASLVVEAPTKSGALITAQLAKKFEKQVYAVPGSIFSRLSEGANDLLKNGAKSATSGTEILKNLGVQKTQKQKGLEFRLSPLEQEVLKLITSAGSELYIDKITKNIKADAGAAATAVMSLVMRDLIKETKPNFYIAIG